MDDSSQDTIKQFDAKVNTLLEWIKPVGKHASSSPTDLINSQASASHKAFASAPHSVPSEVISPEISLANQEAPVQRSIGPVFPALLPAASNARPEKKNKWVSFSIRAAVTLILFFFLLKSVSWPVLLATLIRVHHTDLLLGLGLGILGVVISSYVWRSMVFAERISTDLARLINLYLVGIAFSHFLPTSMGGDAVKAFYLGRESNNMPGATSAVLMSRITGFLGMLLMALPSLFIFHAQFKGRVIVGFLLLCLLWLTAIGGAILAAAFLPRVSTRFLKSAWTRQRIFVKFIEYGSALSGATRRPRAMGVAILFGMCFWITTCLSYYAYATALGLHVPLSFFVVAIPFASILASLPISINGFGVRESIFVYLFSTIHVPTSTSLLLALLMDAQRILFGILGGCIYLTMDRQAKVKRIGDI